MHSLDFRELTPGPGGWLKAAGKLGRHRRVPGAESPRGRAALELFDRLRSALVGGRWESVYDVLSSRLRRAASAGALAEHLRANGAALRKAYRDAVVTRVIPGEGGAVLIVDWGRQGFAFRELKVILEAGEQRFDCVPWGRQLVGRARGERLARVASRWIGSGGGRRGPGLGHSVTFVFLLCLLGLPLGLAIPVAMSSCPYCIKLPLLIFPLLALAAVAVWSPSRRWRRSSRGPDARSLR
jgi:hypothetical protein